MSIELAGEIVVCTCSQLSNFAQNAEKPFRATLLAEPFSGMVSQGFVHTCLRGSIISSMRSSYAFRAFTVFFIAS
jgi:hypothetical protein